MLDNVAQKQLFNIITIMRSPFCYALSAKHPPHFALRRERVCIEKRTHPRTPYALAIPMAPR